MRKLILLIIILLSNITFSQERFIKSELSDFIKKELGTKTNYLYDSLKSFKKTLKVGLYGSKLVPSSACQFQNSNGFSAKMIWDFSEYNSAFLDFTYIYNSVQNKSTNTKSSYFSEISVNIKSYLERYDFNIFFIFGLNCFTYFNPNDGISGSQTGAYGIHAGLGLDYSISEKISIEALAKANLFFSLGLGRYYTINLGLNYRIFKF